LERELSDLEELMTLSDSEEYQKEFDKRLIEVGRDIDKAEVKSLLSQPYDRNDAIISIYSGAGGRDAQDWASMLTRMYERWAQSEGFSVKVLHQHFGEEGGVKNTSLEIEGEYAYGYLKNESGVHRLVRISPFSAQKLRHTSFALVEVLPVIETPKNFVINQGDLKFETFRSSGPGGQNVNKRETAVRVIHLPTGLQVASQASRNQTANKELALKILYAKIYQLMQNQRVETLDKLKVEQREPEWGSQIRSYVLHPYKLVKDHRTGFEVGNIESVLDGAGLSEFIWQGLSLNQKK